MRIPSWLRKTFSDIHVAASGVFLQVTNRSQRSYSKSGLAIAAIVIVIIAFGLLYIFAGQILATTQSFGLLFHGSQSAAAAKEEYGAVSVKNWPTSGNVVFNYAYKDGGVDISLEDPSRSGLILDPQPIARDADVKVRYVPLGKQASDLLINVGDLYEVVVGDNDYLVTTLKQPHGAIQEVPWDFVPEFNSGNVRTPARFPMSPGTEASTRVSQRSTDDGRLEVNVTTLYKPAGNPNADLVPSHDVFFFRPAVNPKDLILGVGLVGSAGATSSPRVQIHSVEITPTGKPE